MFKKKTVFIVGAGGSREVDLPMGTELKGDIASKLRFRFSHNALQAGDQGIFQAVTASARLQGIRDTNPFWKAGQTIADAMPLAPSIDNFLHTHADKSEVILMGKLAITKCILEAERSSRLMIDQRFDDRINFNAIEPSWHGAFVEMLLEGKQAASLGGVFDNVSFITFNYDRCIEHYLAHALRTYLVVSADEAYALVNRLKIIHPYGQVGKLPWQTINGIPFGAEPAWEALLTIAGQIRTFTERVEDDEVMAEMHGLLREADQIVCLGFAYGAMNLELMSIAGYDRRNDLRVLGTSLRFSAPNQAVSGSDLKRALSARYEPELVGLTCETLLRNYSRGLMN